MSKEENDFSDSDLEQLTKNINDQVKAQLETQREENRETEQEPQQQPEEFLTEQEPQLDNYAPDLQTQGQPYQAEQLPPESRKRNPPSKVKRENARLLEAVNLLAEENARLKEETNYAVKVALENAQKELEQQAYMAELALTQAVENGDAQSIGQATRKIAELATERSKQETYARTPVYEDTKPQYIQSEINPLDTLDDFQELPYGQFLERNSWADPRSQYFNPSLATETDEAAKMLDKHLATTRQQHLISTPWYFNEIEGYMKDKYSAKQYPNPNKAPARPVAQQAPVQNNTPYKASVRPGIGAGGTGGYYDTNLIPNNNSNNPRSIRLSKEEEEMALRGVGDSNEEKLINYMNEKIKLMKKGK